MGFDVINCRAQRENERTVTGDSERIAGNRDHSVNFLIAFIFILDAIPMHLGQVRETLWRVHYRSNTRPV